MRIVLRGLRTNPIWSQLDAVSTVMQTTFSTWHLTPGGPLLVILRVCMRSGVSVNPSALYSARGGLTACPRGVSGICTHVAHTRRNSRRPCSCIFVVQGWPSKFPPLFRDDSCRTVRAARMIEHADEQSARQRMRNVPAIVEIITATMHAPRRTWK